MQPTVAIHADKVWWRPKVWITGSLVAFVLVLVVNLPQSLPASLSLVNDNVAKDVVNTDTESVLEMIASMEEIKCLAPSGEYTGQTTILEYSVFATVRVARRSDEANGTLDLTVTSTPNLVTFGCAGEHWRLKGDHEVVVDDEDCWEANVKRNIDDLTMHWLASQNAILLRGTHRIWLVNMPVELTLASPNPCTGTWR